MSPRQMISLVSATMFFVCLTEICFGANPKRQYASEIIPVEVFYIQQLPVTMSGVELIKSEGGYRFRCSMTNYSDEKLLGFRYSLIAVESDRATTFIANPSEAWVLRPYETKQKAFSTTIPLKLKNQVRYVLMLEQIVGRDSIWEVVKAKDALEAYASGDYSIVPVVLRVPNHVDVAPLQQRIRY